MQGRPLSMIVLGCLSLVSGKLFAQSDPAASVCLAVLKLNLYDRNSVYSEQYHFSEYQSLLKTAHFSSYNQYSSEGASLGIDVPLGDVLIGFNGDYKTNSTTFQRQIDTFLASTYNENAIHNIYVSQSATINKQLLQVADNCATHYYESLKDRVLLSVEVEPSSYENFTVKLKGYIPSIFKGTSFTIEQIEPTPDVTCTESGKHISLPEVRADGLALYKCTKQADKGLAFAVRTNIAISEPLTLPSKPLSEPAKPTPVAAAVLQANWSDTPPTFALVQPLSCACTSTIAIQSQGKNYTRIVNNCTATTPIVAIKDSDPLGIQTAFPLKRHGRIFSYVTLQAGGAADFDITDSKSAVFAFLACPGGPVAEGPLACHLDATPPLTTPWCSPPYGWQNGRSVPQDIQSFKFGDPCTCGLSQGHIDQFSGW